MKGVQFAPTLIAALFSLSQSAQSASFFATGEMSVPRYDHTATLLPNGRVLVTGGETNLLSPFVSPTSSAELYEPSTETWVTTGAMTTPRENHTATLLFTGKVLVAGGADDLSGAELYDPVTGTWKETGSMNEGRVLHTATLLPNGKVLVVGGVGVSGDYVDSLSSTELYDPATEKWTTTGTLHTKRDDHTAALLPNGKVLIASGYNFNDVLLSTELYDPVTGTWTETGGLATVSGVRTSTLLPNGKVLLARGYRYSNPPSGYFAELYDPNAETWTVTSALASGGGYHSAVLLPDGTVLIAGGYGPGGDYLRDAEVYDPVADVWASTDSMTTARKNHTATLLTNGKVLVAGGYQDNWVVLSSAELYESVGNPVTTITLATAADLPSWPFRFVFTNSHGAMFAVQATTNLTAPSSNWTTIGCAIEFKPGEFQFADTNTTNVLQRFYRTVSVP